ncbi:hypothetical protein M404DRAFT_633052 [Pisolithus tinctorius Marx 270]|uniref:Uncharacterized protein n=1 Tax=Pisolithus tinctorius Marx 270 TaxID=870435 RepID=A0A0C3P6S5_PISTI|nr:hypothetical protein M404DRAFT_633052 [Pisolithus tinctorius Marx 270]
MDSIPEQDEFEETFGIAMRTSTRMSFNILLSVRLILTNTCRRRNVGLLAAFLKLVHCFVFSALLQHKNFVVVRRKTDPCIGYVRFAETERLLEVEILKFIDVIRSPMNPVLSGVEFRPVYGRTLVSMRAASDEFRCPEKPDEHLWSAASQLVKGGTFMHIHLAAHMDLEYHHSFRGGRLSIINFNASIRLKSTRVGTKGCITPGSNAVIRTSQLKPTCGVVGDLVFNLQAIPWSRFSPQHGF